MKSDVSTGWLAYRQLQRRYAAMKIYVVGIRSLMAVQFILDPTAPATNSITQKISSAIARAFDPSECMPLLEDGYKDYTRLIWEYGRIRNDTGEQVVAASVEMLDSFLRPGQYPLAPMIDIMCLTVECSKISVEAQAWKIAVYRIHRPTLHEARYPPWVQSMRAASEAMVRLSTFTVPPATNGQESIAHGCAGLMASMSRIGQDRSMMLDLNPETASDLPPQLQVLHQELDQPIFPAPGPGPQSDPTYTHSLETAHGPGGAHQHQHQTQDHGQSQPQQQHPLPHQHQHPHEQQGDISDHGYMNTSDRWMAAGPDIGAGTTDGAGPNTTNSNDQYPQQYDTHHPVAPVSGQPPVMIDRVLSEAFWYNYQQPPPQSNGTSGHPEQQAQAHVIPVQAHHPDSAPTYGNQDGMWPPPPPVYNG